MKSTHVVTYNGQGVWRDAQGNLYHNRESHTFQSQGTEEDFLNSRGDIKFMKEYGNTVTVSTASIEEPVVIQEPVAPVQEPVVEAKPVVEEKPAKVKSTVTIK